MAFDTAAMARLLLALLLVLGWTAPARADDIGATARGVVRVVTIAVVDGQVVGFGHGSGVAIAPNRIVTNAHVVDLAERYPDNVVVGVVPSEGDKSYQGRVIAYDAKADLALIEFKGASLPPAALYTGPIGEGDAVVALGYPGNVDLATAQSAADYIRPTSPVRSEGVFSGRRSLTGTEVLLHTASIARGNSGGPLLDRCGRVIGINSAITRGEEGDSSFGFAIADTELAAFLRRAGQPFATTGAPCTSIEERLRSDSEADARARADALTTAREAATRAAMGREEALATAREAAQARRENVMGVAGLLLVLGALGFGGAGLLDGKGRRRPALWAAGIGAATMAAGIATFVLRPSARADLPPAPAAVRQAVPNAPLGKLVCTLQPDASRVTVSPTDDVTLDWGRSGCADGTTQYLATGDAWQRLTVPDDEQTVSLRVFDPVTRRLTITRYMLGAQAMQAMRGLAAQGVGKRCTVDPLATERLVQQQAAQRASLPPLPNEKLVYTCRRAG